MQHDFRFCCPRVLLRSPRAWVIPKRDSLPMILGFVVPGCYCFHLGLGLFPKGDTHHDFRVCRPQVLLRSSRDGVIRKRGSTHHAFLEFVVPECYCIHPGLGFCSKAIHAPCLRVCRPRVLLRSSTVWGKPKEDLLTMPLRFAAALHIFCNCLCNDSHSFCNAQAFLCSSGGFWDFF